MTNETKLRPRLGLALALLLLSACASDTPKLPPKVSGEEREELESARLLAYKGRARDAFNVFMDLAKSEPDLIEAWTGAYLSIPDGAARLQFDQALAERLNSLPSDATAIQRLPFEVLQAEQVEDLVEREQVLYTLLRRTEGYGRSWPRTALARVFMLRGNERAALKAFEAARNELPPFAEADLGYATAAIALGQELDAIPAYERYLQSRPRDPKALYNLALLLQRKRQRPRDARPYLERALAVLPDDVDILINLGSVLLLLDDPEVAEAERAYRRALQVAPDEPDIHYNLGVLLADHKDEKQEAIDHFKRYLELGGSSEARIEAWIAELQEQIKS